MCLIEEAIYRGTLHAHSRLRSLVPLISLKSTELSGGRRPRRRTICGPEALNGERSHGASHAKVGKKSKANKANKASVQLSIGCAHKLRDHSAPERNAKCLSQNVYGMNDFEIRGSWGGARE